MPLGVILFLFLFSQSCALEQVACGGEALLFLSKNNHAYFPAALGSILAIPKNFSLDVADI